MICEKCGREYKRAECEFCKREERWKKEQKFILSRVFTPRILDDLERDYYSEEKLKKYYEDFFLTEGKNSLYVYGNVGTGKTVFVASLLAYHLKRCFVENIPPSRCLFTSVPAVLCEIRACFSEGSEITENELIGKYNHVDWLILDDLGVEKNSSWVFQTLYLIINYRYEYRKPTLFTSNLSLDSLATQLKDDRLSSRIIGMSRMILLDGNDKRLE